MCSSLSEHKKVLSSTCIALRGPPQIPLLDIPCSRSCVPWGRAWLGGQQWDVLLSGCPPVGTANGVRPTR